MNRCSARQRTRGKIVTIEVFQSEVGNPILIHFGKEDASSVQIRETDSSSP